MAPTLFQSRSDRHSAYFDIFHSFVNRLPPDWDDLRLFAAIAAEGSLSAAARRLNLSQPTLGRRLQTLEARMGAKLLERMGGGPGASYVLTPKGAELLPLVERMVEAG